MVKALTVDLNDVRVGELSVHSGEMQFEYAESWLRSPLVRSLSLSLPVTQRVHKGQTILSFFGNLLPDNPDALKRIAANLHLGALGVFEILEAIGRDCVGAIRLLPVGESVPSEGTEFRLLSDGEIEKTLAGLERFPLGVTAEEDFRISIAGAQQKTAFLKTDEGWALPLGTTPSTHIFKTPIGSLQGNTIDLSDSCENEWLCLEIARTFGLPAARAELFRVGNQRALVVERFDRLKSKQEAGRILRLLTEDFCQALGYSSHLKYEADGGPGIADVMGLLEKSAKADADRKTFMATQVLLWMLNSTDGHAKNYSILIGRGDVFQLAPLYDIISAETLVAKGELSSKKLKLAMGLLGKNRHYRTTEIEARHFVSTAEAVNFPLGEMRDVLKMFADKTESVIAEVRRHLPSDFPEDVAGPIFDLMLARSRKLAIYLRYVPA